jgi:hypothetical protein
LASCGPFQRSRQQTSRPALGLRSRHNDGPGDVRADRRDLADYIDSDLQKVGKAKTLGRPAGLVRLSSSDDLLNELFIAEGLETALTAAAIGLRPVWSTGSTALMASFPVLAGVDRLNIIADHDENGAGERAARAAEARWRGAGREVRVFRTEQIGDLNDAIMRLTR